MSLIHVPPEVTVLAIDVHKNSIIPQWLDRVLPRIAIEGERVLVTPPPTGVAVADTPAGEPEEALTVR